MMVDSLLVRSKGQKDDIERTTATISETVQLLNDVVNPVFGVFLAKMAERGEPPRNVLMGCAAFGALSVAQGIIGSGSTKKEEFADFISGKFREWLFDAIDDYNKGQRNH